jgi:hypothetical protein
MHVNAIQIQASSINQALLKHSRVFDGKKMESILYPKHYATSSSLELNLKLFASRETI